MSAKGKEIFGPVPVTLYHRVLLGKKNQEKPICELVRMNTNYGFDPVHISSSIAADLDSGTDILFVNGDIFVPKGFDEILIELAGSHLQLSYLELALSIIGVSFSGDNIEFLANPAGGFPVINPDLLARFDDHSELKTKFTLPFVFNLKVQQASRRLGIRLRSEEGYLVRLQIIARDGHGGSHIAYDITQAPSTAQQTQPETETALEETTSNRKRSRSLNPIEITHNPKLLSTASNHDLSTAFEQDSPKRRRFCSQNEPARNMVPVVLPDTTSISVQNDSQGNGKSTATSETHIPSSVPLMESDRYRPDVYRPEVLAHQQKLQVPLAHELVVTKDRWSFLASDSGYSSQSSGSSFPPAVNSFPKLNPSESLPDTFNVDRHQILSGIVTEAGDVSKPRKEEDMIVRCICGKEEYPEPQSSDIQANFWVPWQKCNHCGVWQHSICVGITAEHRRPEKYFCERCDPPIGVEGQFDDQSDSLSVEPEDSLPGGFPPILSSEAIAHDEAYASKMSTSIASVASMVSNNSEAVSAPEYATDHSATVNRHEVYIPLVARCKNFVRQLFRDRVKDTHQRLEWSCGCGESLYVDMNKSSQAEITRLAAILQNNPNPGYSSTSSMSNLPPRRPPSAIVTDQGSQLTSSPSISSLGSSSSSLASSMSSMYSASLPLLPNQSYLELCINTGEYTKTLSEIDLSHVSCDGELFKLVRSEYLRLRSFRSKIWLLKPSGVHFVKFAVQNRHRVGILQKPLSIPPQNEVDAKNYYYTPCPLQGDPPMPPDIFLHYLSCTEFDPAPAWLPRLPKKLDPSILRFTGAINEGWGIHIKEGPNWSALGWINLFVMMLSGLAAGLWKYFMNDFQGAFGFAGWIVAVVNAILVAWIARWSTE